jgi:hypothetical protein
MPTVPYNTIHGVEAAKSYAPARGVSTDQRSRYFDPTLHIQRDYRSTTEVFETFPIDTPENAAVYRKFRDGGFPIFIHDGGTLNPDGTYTGGSRKEYWFKNGTDNAHLVEKTTVSSSPGGGGASITEIDF